MKILACHNYYQQPGGEDQCFQIESQLLESEGHEVIRYTRHNDDIRAMNPFHVAAQTIWNRQTYAEIRKIIQQEKPDVMHCTNIFPLISPAVYYAARRESVPVVQSLHNYRLLCANAQFLRNSETCEKCLSSKLIWPAVVHRCYKNSLHGSAVVASMLTFHRMLRTFQKQVDVFIALTEFARSKFIDGGIPADKIFVAPNFLPINTAAGSGAGGYGVFVGRLSPEKGVDVLLKAWSQQQHPIQLKIVGDGPLADRVRSAANDDTRIEWLGRQSPERVLDLLANAACLILPSIWYEGLPRTVVEAFAVGTPVIASRIGAMIDLISPGANGFHFETGNQIDLNRVIETFFSEHVNQSHFRQSARQTFEQKFTATKAYQNLMSVYAKAQASMQSHTAPRKQGECIALKN